MCCESETKSEAKSSFDPYITAGSQKAIEKASALSDKPYSGKPLDIADFSADQQTAFQKLRDLVNGQSTTAGIRTYTDAPAQTVGTERIVDQGGKLGAIDDYLNPYRELALNPALQAIQEQSDAQRKRIGAMATPAGAFGDARHGILEAQLGRDTSKAVGDTAATFMTQGFDTAMGQRAADLNRFLTTDTTNANFAESALGRKLQGDKEQQAQLMQQIQALLASGGIQQGQEQAKNQATFDDFLRSYGHDFASLEALTEALARVPKAQTQVTTQTAPDNSIMQTLGSVAGAAAGTEAGAAGLASMLAFI